MIEMSPDQWHKTVDDYLVETGKLKGQIRPATREHTNVFSFPLCYREVTEDLIRIFCAGIGNSNPLYTDPDYAATTRWGGLIAPPHFENRISEGPAQPPPCPVPGYNAWLGGGEPITREYFRPYRPGDVIDAVDEFLGIEEITDPNEPFRKFRQASSRTFLDQNEQPVSVMTGRVLFVATPPDKVTSSRQVSFTRGRGAEALSARKSWTRFTRVTRRSWLGSGGGAQRSDTGRTLKSAMRYIRW